MMGAMAGVTIYHNPNCSTSNHAIRTAEELGIAFDRVLYLKQPPDRETLAWLLDHLEDPPADLVRKDSYFEQLGLNADDYTEPEPIIELLLEHPRLMQRPLIVKGEVVIIGRPKDRVARLLAADRA
jgi:arsenate reductase